MTDKLRHHWVVRVTHWVNAVALTIMVGSGLRIFNAYPAFARKGETFCCYPFEGKSIPAALTFGGWLAGARQWHFAMMWVLVVNGIVYLAFIYLHGDWRDVVPRRGFFRNAREMIKFYLFVRKRHPRQGKYNALQRATYFSLPVIGVLAVASGVAIWKPVQLAPLADLMGGYVWARYWHFVAMSLLVMLSVIHVFMVFATDPYSLRSMFTGGYNENNSPEARNARPFYNLLPNKRGDEAEGPVDELVAHDESLAPVKPVETLNVKMSGVQPGEVANQDTPQSSTSAPLHPDSPSDAPHDGANK